MSLFSSNQLRSVIEWKDPLPDDLIYKWTDRGDEIKNASKLLVNPGQAAIFVYEGKIQDVHTESGLYELQTANIPFITTIKKFMQAFESEHKVGIYFVRITEILNQKWGTKAPIKYLDPVYHFPVGLRAFGNFSFKFAKPSEFFINIAGVRNTMRVADITTVLTDKILQPLTDLMAESNYSYIEVDKNREELAALLAVKLAVVFEDLGFTMTDFRIENTDFDDDTTARIGKIANAIVDAEAAKSVGLSYAQMQQLQALRDAAKNEGAAGTAVGLGAGLGLGQTMIGGMAQMFGQNPGQNPPQAAFDPVEALAKLKKMLDGGLITQLEYDGKKAEILSKM
jgi:membrane protease subunit (stomatin/prohibitin family)